MQDVVKKIEFHVRPIIENLELELWGLEIQSGAKHIVRIYLQDATDISNSDSESNVQAAGIDECAKVSRLVGLVLDVEEFFAEPWILEVSTPGLDRVFFFLEQMKDYCGKTVLVNLNAPVEAGKGNEKVKSRRKIQGKLTSVSDESFEVVSDHDGISFEISWNNVKRAKLVPEFEDNSAKALTSSEEENKKEVKEVKNSKKSSKDDKSDKNKAKYGKNSKMARLDRLAKAQEVAEKQTSEVNEFLESILK